MKAYAIRDKTISRERDLAYLLYYEKEREFRIEVCEDVTEWEAPLILSSFVKRGQRTIDAHWSRIWVEQRIVPRERQNLGMILRESGLKEYDEYELLVRVGGRCAQDDCYLVQLGKRDLPAELQERLQKTVVDVIPWKDAMVIFFRDGRIFELETQTMNSATAAKKEEGDPRMANRLKAYAKEMNSIRVKTGGHGIEADGAEEITAEELRNAGRELPFDGEILRKYMQRNLLTTSQMAEKMGCTRQNVIDLVRRGKLEPVAGDTHGYLFLTK